MTDADDARYQIALPTGNDGPYTLGDLRRLAETGRLHADDHILDSVRMTTHVARELLPGLAEGTGQVRVRSSSDRLPAQPPIPRPRTQHTPLPTDPSPELATPAAPAEVFPSPSLTPTRHRYRFSAWTLTAFAAIFAVTTIAGVWYLQEDTAPPLLPLGQWSVASLPPIGGPWLIEVRPGQVVIRGPDGVASTSAWTMLESNAQHCLIELAAPHAVLGGRLRFAVNANGFTLSTPVANGPVQHVPAI